MSDPFLRIAPPYKYTLLDAESAKARLDICKACENYDDGRCILCNCNMKKKVYLKEASCGDHKW